MAREQLKVDLRGIVDILSHHLYSTQGIYLRELLQNAVDAVEARLRAEAGAAGQVVITPARDGEPLVVRDTGIGLTLEEMRSLLATVGGSSKRDDVSATRGRFLGQFGIGLLSSFLVADEVSVRSRSAREPNSPTVRWTAHADGTFEVGECPDEPLDEPGTEVRLVPREQDAHWCGPDTVRDLAADFAELIDVPVRVGRGTLSQRPAPWEMPVEDQLAWCRSRLGFEPMGIIPLDSSALGVRGVGFVLPYTAQPGHRTGDRIYSRGMWVADGNDQLLPSWAFFCRAVIDAGDLTLTASREALQETPELLLAREKLGARLMAELIMVQATHPEVYQDIVRLHATGLKALALEDTDMRSLLRDTLRLRTTRGELTVRELQDAGERPVRYVTDAATFDALREVAVHAGVVVVDAGGPHDPELLEAFDAGREEPLFVATGSAEVARLAAPAPAEHEDLAAAERLSRAAAAALEGEEVTVQVSAFEPPDRPVLWWPAADGRETATLALNTRNPTVRALLEEPDSGRTRSTVAALYVLGLLLGRTPVSPAQVQRLSLAVQDLAVGGGAGAAAGGSA